MLKREELSTERVEQIVADARAAGFDFFLSQEEREASLAQALNRYQPGEEAWVFAYGSLMWNPAIEFADASACEVEGWRRSFCFWLPLGRGTPELPGLMLALERGGSCEGIAYRIPDGQAKATLAYLRAREQVNGVYREAHVQAQLLHLPSPSRGGDGGGGLQAPTEQTSPTPYPFPHGGGEHVTAVAYVVERRHPSYAGRLPLAEQVRIIRAARGISGCN